MEPDKIIESTIDAIKRNDESLIQIIDELKQTQYYNSLPSKIKILINNALFDNGVFNKLDFGLLNENQYFSICLWTLNFNDSFKNKYYVELLKHYQSHFNDSIEKSNYNQLPFIVDYYQKTPSAFVIKDAINFKYEPPKLINKHLKYISELIKIGSCIQFNCPGFVKNELIYLISGLCVVYHDKPLSFLHLKDLVHSIQSFIQLIPSSISLDASLFAKGSKNYGLSTQLLFNEKKGYENIKIDDDAFNYRYKPAFEYLKNEINGNRTKVTRDESGMRLSTEYNEQQLNELWEQLETEFSRIKTSSDENEKNKAIQELLITWFDSQCLTRSTCLCGVLMLMIFTRRKIKLQNNELIDWKAIITGTIDGTYELLEKFDYIETKDFEELTLLDVLTITKYYVDFIITH